MNQDDTQNPFSTRPKEAPKKVKPVGGAMGFFDGETESEDPLGSTSHTIFDSLKNAPFNLVDSSHPAEKTDIEQASFMGSIDFVKSNRVAQETQRINELQAEIADGGNQVIVEKKAAQTTYQPQIFTSSRFNLSEISRIKDYIKFGEFFSIIGGEGRFGFKAIKSLFVENILQPKKNPKLEARQKMTPDQLKEEDKKQVQKRNKASFFSQLRQIMRGSSGMERVLNNKRQNINMQVGFNAAFEGSIDEKTGGMRIDLQILADKKNSEMQASELKAKKQQQIAAVSGGGKNLRTHLGAQEGQSMVANAVLTAG